MGLVKEREVAAIDLSVRHVDYYTISTRLNTTQRVIITRLGDCDRWLFECEL